MRSIFWVNATLLFCFNAFTATPRFLKSDHCVKWLTLNYSSDIPRTVDLGSYRRNLLKLGYPNQVIDEKINEMVKAPEEIKTILENYPATLDSEQIKELASGVNNTKILDQLGYWQEIPGFLADEFIWEFILFYKSNLFDRHVKSLLYWSHLWMNSPRAYNIAKLLLQATNDPHFSGWLLKEYQGPKKDFLMRAITRKLQKTFRVQPTDYDYHQFLLKVASYIPTKFIPKEIRDNLNYWIDTKNYPSVVNDAVETTYFGELRAGNCQFMTCGHIESLGLMTFATENWKRNILIRVNGMLVGSLKLHGNASMLALRNVVNSDGQTVLVQGGVYTLPVDLVNEIFTIKLKKSTWQGVDLTSLKVVPHSIMLNDNAWSELNDASLLELAKDGLTKDKLVEVAIAFSDSEETIQDLLENKTWPELLKRIDKIRRAFEKK
jgi:hypothetical protein